jgi:hypothetical protein
MKVGSFGTKLVDSEMPSVDVSYEQETEKKLSKYTNGWIKVVWYLINGMVFVVEGEHKTTKVKRRLMNYQ